jgi:hypothetical protein
VTAKTSFVLCTNHAFNARLLTTTFLIYFYLFVELFRIIEGIVTVTVSWQMAPKGGVRAILCPRGYFVSPLSQ